VTVVLGFNYEAHFALVYKFNNSTKAISATGEHFSVLLANLYCTRAETAIFELPIRILSLPLDSATPISYTTRMF